MWILTSSGRDVICGLAVVREITAAEARNRAGISVAEALRLYEQVKRSGAARRSSTGKGDRFGEMD